MQQVLALTGIAAAATLTISGMAADMRRKHHHPAAIRPRHLRHHHHHNRGGQVLRNHSVHNGPGWGLCLDAAMEEAVGAKQFSSWKGQFLIKSPPS